MDLFSCHWLRHADAALLCRCVQGRRKNRIAGEHADSIDYRFAHNTPTLHMKYLVKGRTSFARAGWYLGPLASFACGAPAENAPGRQTMDEAWWTGPLLAASASTLPQGHFLVEPYLFDVITYGRHDADGGRKYRPAQGRAGADATTLPQRTMLLIRCIILRYAGPSPRSPEYCPMNRSALWLSYR